MKRIKWKYVGISIFMLAALPFVFGPVQADEMKKQQSSYIPVMVTESFDGVRERDIAEKPEVMNKHMALLNKRYDLSGKTDPDAIMSGGKPLPLVQQQN